MINGDVFEIRNNQRMMKEIQLYWTVPADGLVLLDVCPLNPGVGVFQEESSWIFNIVQKLHLSMYV